MSLQALKGLNLDRIIETEEAVALSAYARTLQGEYEALEIPVPDWVAKASDTLRQEIARRTLAADLAEMERIQRELDSYKTVVGERNGEALKRLGTLQRKLRVESPCGPAPR